MSLNCRHIMLKIRCLLLTFMFTFMSVAAKFMSLVHAVIYEQFKNWKIIKSPTVKGKCVAGSYRELFYTNLAWSRLSH